MDFKAAQIQGAGRGRKRRGWHRPRFPTARVTAPNSPASWLDRTLGYAAIALILVIAVFETTSLDLAIQDQLYDAVRGRWLVDPAAFWPRTIFHHLPVALTVVIGMTLLAALLMPNWIQRIARRDIPSRRAVLCALLTIVSVPLLIAGGKRLTNMFCPSEVRRYGGDVCYVRLLESFPENDTPNRRGRCFPAAHASGGFALIGLFALARSRRQQRAVLAVAFLLGWVAGGYQMITGSHYLSHTLVTMFLTWIIFVLWQRTLLGHASRPPPAAGLARAAT